MNLDAMTDEEKMDALDRIQESIRQNKEIQKQKIAANVDLVIQALKKIESDIQSKYDGVTAAIETRVANIKDGRDGRDGIDGKNGRDGLPGKDGLPGPRGLDGKDGVNGLDGVDGVSVVDARIDFDGSLVIYLSSGREINVGEVVPMDLAERIKVITNGGGTSQSVLDTLASLQTQINNISTGNITSIASADGSVTVTNVSGAIDLSVAVAASTTNVIVQVRNVTGATLTKGTVVYINGVTGQIPTVTKAIASADSTSAQTLGVMSADLANNSNGYVTIIGLITNVNTSAYTDGEQLYLSGTTAGALTGTKPYAPTHLVYVAIVEYAHPTQGKLFIKVQNGYELDELHDVAAQNPSNNDIIIYNSTSTLWEKSTLTAGTNISVTKNSTTTTIGVTGTLPIANGGTNATSAPAAMASLMGFTSTATAAGTTTLTNTSSYYQVFTGTTTQTIVLPVTSTLVTGWTFHICNNSTGVLTVNSSGGNLLISIPAGTTAMCTCIGTALTTAADWEAGLTDFSTATGTGSVVLATSPTLTTPVFSSIVNTGTLTLPTSTDTLVARATTDTLTNKRVTPRVVTTTSSATPTINTDNTDQYGLTAQTVDVTSFTTNLSGTPTDGQKLWIYIVGTAARAITWGASFESSTVTLPTTTVTTNRLDVGFVWNAATSKWRCVATA